MIARALDAAGMRPALGRLRQHAPRAIAFPPAPAPAAMPLPSIVLVTPSRNQGRFIGATLDSVACQRYPALEYVVVDGASDDDTAAVLERHAGTLSGVIREPDNGQAEAINKGFAGTRGEIMGWLNSDDVLLPGTLAAVGAFFVAHPQVDVVYGDRLLVDESGQAIGRWVLPAHTRDAYSYGDFIPQETMFWRRSLWERVGARLDESYRFALDWELIARFDAAGARFEHLPRFLAAFRVHPEQKTSSQMHSVGFEESERVLRKMHGRRVLPLERALRLIPYMARHVAQDARRKAEYESLLQHATSSGADMTQVPNPAPAAIPTPSFGMQAALEGLRARGYRPAVVYDIGAADGSWTRKAMETWPDAHYVCFEPLAERAGALDALARERPGQVTIHACGVGDADGELSFGVTDFLWDSSFAYSGSSARKVPVRALDSLAAAGAIPPPSFVKVDVQGFERRVVRGGERILAHADFILLECNFIAFCEEMCTLDEMIAFMSQRGFVPYEFVDFLRRPLDGAMGQCDILFARRDQALRRDTRWAA